MKERAYAKINLCLDVVGQREDGYHELKMIMVPIDFYDMLEMRPAKTTTLSLNRYFLPVNEKNTVIKAIRVLRERYGFRQEFECMLTKHIPTQAGLAGGSADAAAAIRILNRMLNLKMSRADIIDCAKQVGADVPFCCLNQPALVEGIGDIITPFECHPDFSLLLVKPRIGISTKVAFENMDPAKTVHPDCEAMRRALIADDYPGILKALGNSLEEVSLRMVDEIRIVKQKMKELGFDGVLMSGSGSTVFGITRDPSLCSSAGETMKQQGYFVRMTKML